MLSALLIAIAIQQTTQQPPIPKNAEDFLSWAVRILVPLALALYGLWQWSLKPLRREIEERIGLEKGMSVKSALDGLGKNVSALEGTCRESATRTEMMERRVSGVEVEQTRMSEEVSEQRGLVTGMISTLATSKQEIINAVNDARREAAAADRQTGERLARLEANIEVARSLDGGFDRIARIMEGQAKRGER